MKTIVVLSLFLLMACASSSGVVEIGPDSYLISKEAGTGFSGVTSLKSDNIKEAGKYCKSLGKFLKITGTNEDSGFGKFPKSEIQFQCLADGDPALKRTVLVPISPAPADKIMGR